VCGGRASECAGAMERAWGLGVMSNASCTCYKRDCASSCQGPSISPRRLYRPRGASTVHGRVRPNKQRPYPRLVWSS
jgi:hypothetical protein